uniref:protein-tyrosine-phosphatase n=1 Tax=Timema douglasi TaxID=61478 RepID=A0A7R8VT85_TIMDO|nr:unnamed protein product [Timema douglasi]
MYLTSSDCHKCRPDSPCSRVATVARCNQLLCEDISSSDVTDQTLRALELQLPDSSCSRVGNGCSSRRILASASNLLPHNTKQKSLWVDGKWLSRDKGTPPALCSETYFVEPLAWMSSVPHSLQGKLHCPKCQNKLGSFSWIMGCQCPCGSKISPAFYFVPSKVEWSNMVQNVQLLSAYTGNDPVTVSIDLERPSYCQHRPGTTHDYMRQLTAMKQGGRRDVASQLTKVSFRANKNRRIIKTVDSASYRTGLADNQTFVNISCVENE